MALFEVPGWSVSTPPVATPSSRTSKKRKKPTSGDSEETRSKVVNLKDLAKTLDGHKSSSRKRQLNKNTREGNVGSSLDGGVVEHADALEQKMHRSPPSQASHTKDQRKLPKKLSQSKLPSCAPVQRNDQSLTALQKNMKDSLDGARFRLINETLYETESAKAHKMIKDDPNMFEEYHIGFRRQVLSWPTNPVSHYISTLSKYSVKTVIADLGCGDAALARALTPKGMTVLSYDLKSDNAFVIEADICGKLPLPGSEGVEGELSDGEGQVVDVVVCALSLMGTNWLRCIREAWRVLRPAGELKIAEVASRIADSEEFISLISSLGFRLTSKDEQNTHFITFEFKKTSRKMIEETKWAKIACKGGVLKPCKYKRR